MKNPIQGISRFLKDRALRKQISKQEEILRKDRMACPPSLEEFEGVPLCPFTIQKVWVVSGEPFSKMRREALIPQAEETREFVNHVFHEETGGEEDHLLMSLPVILVVDKDVAQNIVNPPQMYFGRDANAEYLMRESRALVTLNKGWATPMKAGQRDRPSMPWRYLLHRQDYERITRKNKHAFLIALGYKTLEDKTQNVEPI